MENIIRIITQRIKASGITYAFLARRINISPDLISKTMLGQRRLRADEFIKLCKILNLSLSDFATEGGDPS